MLDIPLLALELNMDAVYMFTFTRLKFNSNCNYLVIKFYFFTPHTDVMDTTIIKISAVALLYTRILHCKGI